MPVENATGAATAARPRIGFVGLGIMGASMAANLQKAGYDVTVHDARPEAAASHRANGAHWARSPAELATTSDVIFLSLPGPPEVEAVVFGHDGLADAVRPGTALFDLSTNSVSMIRRVHAALAQRGTDVFDAPVSGGPPGARSGKLALWVGGDEAGFNRHRPVLSAIGDRVRYLGPVGSGLVAKLVTNCASAAISCVMAEVFTMGVKAGMDPLTLWQAAREGALGRARTFDGLADHFLTGSYDPPDFMGRLLYKDVALATALGRELGVPMRVSNLVTEEITEALNRGWGERDRWAFMLLQQERSGVHVAVDNARIQSVLEQDPRAPCDPRWKPAPAPAGT